MVCIQTSWMRGEDDVFVLCADCKRAVADRKGNPVFEAERIYRRTLSFVCARCLTDGWYSESRRDGDYCPTCKNEVST
jgi:DNA-directed RNA polymerase subunit RPC12/RpoP